MMNGVLDMVAGNELSLASEETTTEEDWRFVLPVGPIVVGTCAMVPVLETINPGELATLWYPNEGRGALVEVVEPIFRAVRIDDKL